MWFTTRNTLPLALACMLAGALHAQPAEDEILLDEYGVDTGEEPFFQENGAAGEDDEFVLDASVSELEQLIGAPGGVRIREFQEDLENPPNLFDSDERIQDIFGDTPRFIYFPEGVDPMIIPWVRERIVAEELFEEARVATANQDWERALGILAEIRENYPNTEHGQRAPAELARVQGLRDAERAPTTETAEPDLPVAPEAQQVVLPNWIAQNTNGVMLSEDPIVIVGNDFLRIGDRVPRYSSVIVKAISESEVVYEFQNQDFAVEVVGTL